MLLVGTYPPANTIPLVPIEWNLGVKIQRVIELEVLPNNDGTIFHALVLSLLCVIILSAHLVIVLIHLLDIISPCNASKLEDESPTVGADSVPT